MNKIIGFIMFVVVGMALVACNDEENKYEKVPDRLFMPPFNTENTFAKNNTILVSWYIIKDAKDYVVELSLDNFATVVKSETTIGNTVLFDGLAWETTYGVRLLARHADGSQNSKYALVTNGLKTENKPIVDMFHAIDALSSSSVSLSWDSYTYPIIKAEVYKNGVLIQTITTGLESNALTLNSLDPRTPYKVILYTNDLDVGTKNFTTYPSNIIIADGSIALDAIIAGNPDGSMILLPYGVDNAITAGWSKSLTFIGGEGGGGEQATLRYNSEFKNETGIALGPIKFENLHISGWNADGSNRAGAVFMGNKGPFESVTFESCTVHGFAYGLLFLQGTGTVVENVTINNCIMYDIATSWGQYSSILTAHHNNAGVGTGFNNISITNSTFYDNPAGIVWNELANSTGSVTIENCTFNDMMKGNFMFLDYGTYEIAGTLTIRNNILGQQKTGGGTAVPGGARVKGKALDPSPFISNNFVTSDYAATDMPIPTTSSAGGASTAIFANPINGDFTVISPTVKRAGVGDPRWLK